METKFLDYRLEMIEKQLKAECYFPGVAYDDFNRTGNLSPWKVCRMFEAGRAIPFRQGNFLDYGGLGCPQTSSYFILGGVYEFHPCLWQIGRTDQYFPYKISIQLVGIGKTSLTIRQVLTNLLDHKELASYTGKLVYVDRATRRPQPLPDWHLDKYVTSSSQFRLELDMSDIDIPDSAFSVKLVVAASDTDHNQHTNQASYVSYSFNVAESARRAQKLRHFTSDVCLYPIDKMSTSYRGETQFGDELTVSVWELDQDPRSLKFAIRRGKMLAFVATVKFLDMPKSKI